LRQHAGILMDKTIFAKMDMAAFRKVVDVHLFGTANVAQCLLAAYARQKYGRIVLTTLWLGEMYGNFLASPTMAAASGDAGAVNVCTWKARGDNIRINSWPTAATRMYRPICFAGRRRRNAGPRDDHPVCCNLVSEDAPPK